MTDKLIKPKNNDQKRSGVALMLALVVLVVLSSVVYKLVSQIANLKHRQEYLIDYQKSRYACDSASKYALSLISKTSISYAEKSDEEDEDEEGSNEYYLSLYDFSDEFQMDQETYEQCVRQWHGIIEDEDLEDSQSLEGDPNYSDLDSILGLLGDLSSEQQTSTESLYLPGPYTYQWPNVIEPIEFAFNDVKVTIAIEDENAKFPLIWATHAGDEETQEAAAIALETFCQWMGMNDDTTNQLFEEIDEIAEYKKFKLSYPPITTTEVVKQKNSSKKNSKRRKKTVKKTVKKQRDPELHARDFAQLILSSIVDIDGLSKTMYDMGDREETPAKYLGFWGADKVNVNTAPRHVLEATFTFGGQAENIADEIIRLRREKTFVNQDDMKERMYGYYDSIKKVKGYICFHSEYFSIKVTASSGKAKTITIMGIRKEKKDIKNVATFVY